MQRFGRPDRVLECEAVQRSAQDAIGRYGRHVSGMPLTDTITQAVARGARHGRASRIPASSGVRSRLVRLHGRHAAATFSHVCGPPLRTRHDVVDRVGALAAVLAAVVVAGEDRPARQRGAAVERHLDHVAQPDDDGQGTHKRRGVEHVAVVFDDVGLVGEHEAGGPSRGHDAERLVSWR